MSFFRIYNVLLVFVCFAFFSCKSETERNFLESEIKIIPKPAELQLNKGSFTIDKNTSVVFDSEKQEKVADYLVAKFEKAAGFSMPILKEGKTGKSIVFKVDKNMSNEMYSLNISKDTILIKANSLGGYLYGVQSLLQLLPSEIEGSEIQNVTWTVPQIVINDAPRFAYRGLMLDISRHFFDKEYIIETIDALFMHKMNVLHLHLVDDQGWRIEIKKYPKLTKVGAWRVDQEDAAWNARESNKPGEKGSYGGYLSQKDLKEIVAYAQNRNIEIIPEIEMPAHVTSAVASYPYLSCHENPVAVPSGGVWPITDIYCAGKETSFEFLEDVLEEVIAIFPSKYIHIGGDEATKTNWEKCVHCKKRMQTENLEDVEELQSYFVKRMEKFINSKGKKLIGWDEILEGGLAPDATVMSWRGVKGGLEASEQGHDVIMTPGSHCYFDHYQGPQNQEPKAWGGYTPLSKVYSFDPIVDGMSPEQANHVLGGQANLWSEYVPTEKQSQYMIYPRIAALSETLWSSKELRNWEDFSTRIPNIFKRYSQKGINYAKSAFLVTTEMEVDLESKSVNVSLQNEFPKSDIRYVIGSDSLNKNATKYQKPFTLSKTTVLKAAIFKDNKIEGSIFQDTIRFHKAVAKEVNYTNPYNDSYKGAGAYGMVNTLRGSKNFHDGQWQGWLGQDMEIVIDLTKKETTEQVSLGSMENQGSGIYFPTKVTVLVSVDGKKYTDVGSIKRDFKKNGDVVLKDFKIVFKSKKARYVKVIATSLKSTPQGGGVWLFVDEIVVN